MSKFLVIGQQRGDFILLRFKIQRFLPRVELLGIGIDEESGRIAAQVVDDGAEAVEEYGLVVIFGRYVEGVGDGVEEGRDASFYGSRCSVFLVNLKTRHTYIYIPHHLHSSHMFT